MKTIIESIFSKLNGTLSKIINFALKYSVLFIFLSIIIALSMPVILSQPSWLIDLGPRGTLGDTINGLSAPFLTSLAVILTYHAFMAQHHANNKQEKWNKEQRNDLIKDRFENKLFHFIDLLSQQESMCKIEEVGEGKQAFHFMFYEFKAILYYVMKADIYNGDQKEKWEFYLTYYIFINGASESAIDRLLSDIPEMCKNCQQGSIDDLNTLLLDEQRIGMKGKKSIYMLTDYKKKKIKYFDGHRLRLIPFYRHLCMIIQYIYEDDAPNTLKDKVFYLHIICSQLSEHELALLLIMYTFGDKERYCPTGDDNYIIIHFFEDILPQYINPKMDCREKDFSMSIKKRIGRASSSEKPSYFF